MKLPSSTFSYAGFLLLVTSFLTACSPKPAETTVTDSAKIRRPITEEQAVVEVEKRFDLKRHITNEFIPAPGATPLPPLSPLRKLRIGTSWVANDQVAPWFIGIGKGFFRDAGLDVEIVEGGPGRDLLGSLVAGHIDIFLGFSDSIFRVLTSPTGADLVMIGVTGRTPFAAWIMLDPNTPKDQRSTRRLTKEDLRGKRVGLQPGSDYIANWLCDQLGLSMNDIKIVNAGATPDVLMAGAIDFYQGWLDNQPRMIERNGYKNWTSINFSDYGFLGYGDVSTVTRAFYERDPDVLRRYMAALDRSLRFMIEHREEAADIVVKATAAYHYTREEVLWRFDQDIPIYEGDGSQPLLAMDEKKMQRMLARLYLYRQIDLPEKK